LLYLSEDDVLQISEWLWGQMAVDREQLARAVDRPKQTVLSGEPAFRTLPKKAAALFEALVRNKPFRTGNQLTALVATNQFCNQNGMLMTDPAAIVAAAKSAAQRPQQWQDMEAIFEKALREATEEEIRSYD
jgi:prophage maintenance system killer protein